MFPGPTIIRQCSLCSSLFQQMTLLSGNTFGGRFWTDGKSYYPMLPEQPLLVKCPCCEQLIWINDQEESGEAKWLTEDDPDCIKAPPYSFPTAEDYFSFLSNGLPGQTRELYIRIRAWRAANDPRREGAQIELSENEIYNLTVIAGILDRSDQYSRILAAEIHRELSNYKLSIELLSVPFKGIFIYIADLIRQLSIEKVNIVREIKF